ncbi:MAG: NAD(P)/FAD-dependent oxidoreductase [Myxococcota bacterium]
MVEEQEWDVIVVGAGPGGSATATVLAEGGARVLVLEREFFPRFHVGESLLPAAEIITTLLDIEQDPNIFLYKSGAQFVCEETGRTESFDFGEAMAGPQRYAWHVDRAKFDKLLMDRAIEAGAVVRQGMSVEDLDLDEDEVRVHWSAAAEADTAEAQGTIKARYLIDATGQDRLLAKKRGTGQAFDRFGKAAAFMRFENIGEAAREEFSPNNDVRIVVIPDGWLWCIPLTGNRISVGMVSRLSGLRKEHLLKYLDESPLFQRLLAGATPGEPQLIGNFSFENRESFGPRFACVGDAACFIDPVFSSGVSLAIGRGIETAEQLLTALEDGSEARPDLMEPVQAKMQRGYDTFAALVHRFYNTKFIDNIIFGAPKDGDLRPGVISVLAGDVYREDNPFQNMLLQSKRHQVRSVPFPTEPSSSAVASK